MSLKFDLNFDMKEQGTKGTRDGAPSSAHQVGLGRGLKGLGKAWLYIIGSGVRIMIGLG